MGKRPVQELADARLAPEYRQPVKTLEEALTAIGWQTGVDVPECCGHPVKISAFIGTPYSAICEKCDRFLFDVTGPEFGNSYVSLPDGNEYDLDTPCRWVSGQRANAEGADPCQ